MLVTGYVELMLAHGVDGQRVFINPKEITSLREPSGSDRPYFVRGSQCVVLMADAKFIAVRETCDEIRRLMRTP